MSAPELIVIKNKEIVNEEVDETTKKYELYNILKEDFLWLLIMCVLSASSHFMMVKTLQVAEASVIQPFSYLQLVFGSIIGVTIFSESIDSMIVVGVTIVIGAGLFTAWREYIKKHTT